MFIYLFVCLFVCWPVFYFNHLGRTTGMYPTISLRSDLIWLRYSSSRTCLFVCLFDCLFVDLFCFYFILIILEHPQEYTLKILWRLDLIWLRYIGFLNMFICLFVCLLNCLFFILIILGPPQEYTLKSSWGLDLILLRY